MAVVLQNLYESKGTSFTSALAVSRQSSTSQKADPEFVLKPIAEGLLHNIAQLVVPNLLVLRGNIKARPFAEYQFGSSL